LKSRSKEFNEIDERPVMAGMRLAERPSAPTRPPFCVEAGCWGISQADILPMDRERGFGLAKLTLVWAVLLVALGLAGYVGTGGLHPTALIPAWFGLALGICGFLAISPNEGRRKLFMHINVTIALIGFIGAAEEAIHGYVHATSLGMHPDQIAMASKITMAALLLIYVLLCVRSFMAARRTGKV
jgi:hypothetical protein